MTKIYILPQTVRTNLAVRLEQLEQIVQNLLLTPTPDFIIGDNLKRLVGAQNKLMSLAFNINDYIERENEQQRIIRELRGEA